MKTPSHERLMQVLVAPLVSEKTTFVTEKLGQIVFVVRADATKVEVKAAIELLLKVKVERVQVSNLKGKMKRVGRFAGRRNDIKKAFISLKSGEEFNFAELGGI